jgi:hypothetical protein
MDNQKEYQQNWYYKNREHKLAHAKKYRSKPEIKERIRKFFLKNRIKYQRYHKKYDKEYRLQHKEKEAQKQKKYRPKYLKSPRGLTLRILGGMVQRCTNENCNSYHNYGGRGIKVCDRWRGKGGGNRFISDMGLRPSIDYSIHRLDNDYNYCKENSQWILKTKHYKMNGKRRK